MDHPVGLCISRDLSVDKDLGIINEAAHLSSLHMYWNSPFLLLAGSMHFIPRAMDGKGHNARGTILL
jgi:hypothetical protein